jgi:probable HAF family extracellular repeat protein
VRSFVWHGGKLRDLGAIPGLRYTLAVAINDRGQVVGTAYGNGPPTWEPSRAFVWQNGKMTALSPPGTSSAAEAVNEIGQIVGNLRKKPSGYGSACLWQSGQTVDLGTPPGEGVDWLGSYATSLNDHGQIVGVAIEAKGNHAFVWENGQMTLLPTLGGASSDADAVNERGQIIGHSETQSGESHAVLWTAQPAGSSP